MSPFVVVPSRVPGLADEDLACLPVPSSFAPLTPSPSPLRVMTSSWSSAAADRHEVGGSSDSDALTERPGWHVVSIETCFDAFGTDLGDSATSAQPDGTGPAASAERPDDLHEEVTRLLRLERIRQLRGLVGVALSLALASVALALSDAAPTPQVAPSPVATSVSPGELAIADEPELPGPASQ